MDNKLFKQIRDYEDYVSDEMVRNMDKDDINELFILTSAYATSYLPFFESVKTDASDSMMLLKIYTTTLKKLERAIVTVGSRMVSKAYEISE